MYYFIANCSHQIYDIPICRSVTVYAAHVYINVMVDYLSVGECFAMILPWIIDGQLFE